MISLFLERGLSEGEIHVINLCRTLFLAQYIKTVSIFLNVEGAEKCHNLPYLPHWTTRSFIYSKTSIRHPKVENYHQWQQGRLEGFLHSGITPLSWTRGCKNTAPMGLDAVFYNKDSVFSRGSLWRNFLLTMRPGLPLVTKRIIFIRFV